MRSVFRAAIAAGLVAAFAAAQAWNGIGHMVIATIAQQRLTDVARKEANRLLAVAPAGTTAPGTWSDFVLVSTWADETRTKENGPWHYVDYHFRSDGKPVTTHPDAENAVWAIDKFSKVLADKTRSDADRAEALRFLIHFVGDIHQPLHATARDTDAEPTGDRGGNDFHIQNPAEFSSLDRPLRNLHALWDFGGGLFRPFPGLHGDDLKQKVAAQADQITAKNAPAGITAVTDQDPDHWAHESFELSKSVVYALTENEAPSPEYLTKAREVSAQRAAAAGYRLADLLNKLLG